MKFFLIFAFCFVGSNLAFASGIYSIQNRLNLNCVGSNVPGFFSDKCQGGNLAQQIEVIHDTADYYLLKNSANGKCLNAYRDATSFFRLREVTCRFGDWSSQWKIAGSPFQIENLVARLVSHETQTEMCLNSQKVAGLPFVLSTLAVVPCASGSWSQQWVFKNPQSSDLTWDSLVTSQCHGFHDSSLNNFFRIPREGLSSDCGPLNSFGKPKQAWLIGSTNEERPFHLNGYPDPVKVPRDGTAYDFLPNETGHGRVYQLNYDIKSIGSSNHSSLEIALDKFSSGFDNYHDQLTYVGFSDNFDYNKTSPSDYPLISDNLWIDLQFALKGQYSLASGPTFEGPGIARALIAAKIETTDRIYFLEFNLWREDLADNCLVNENRIIYHNMGSEQCDSPLGIFDRRSQWTVPAHIKSQDPSKKDGEYIQIDIRKMHLLAGYPQPWVPRPNGNSGNLSYEEVQRFPISIPLSEVFGALQNSSPYNISGAKVSGIYMGVEVWGGAWIWTEFSEYRLYSVQ